MVNTEIELVRKIHEIDMVRQKDELEGSVVEKSFHYHEHQN